MEDIPARLANSSSNEGSHDLQCRCFDAAEEISRLRAENVALTAANAASVGRDNKVQMHVDLNEAYSVLLDLTHKLNIKKFNADLRKGRSFLSRMVDISDYPPC